MKKAEHTLTAFEHEKHKYIFKAEAEKSIFSERLEKSFSGARFTGGACCGVGRLLG